MPTDNHKVSLVICTKDRSQILKRSISKIIATVNRRMIPVYLIDQSVYSNTQLPLYVQYIHMPHAKGLSVSRNTALIRCKTPLIAFTDDDCIITNQYAEALQNLNRSSWHTGNVAIIFGRTEPYQKAQHSHEYCPCTFSKSDSTPVDRITEHWKYIGYGNNMVIHKEVIDSIGLFKPWLGTGSIGESAEDAEYAIRCLIAGYALGYNQNLLVRHDRWLSPHAMRSQSWKYTCGGIAAYGFYYIQGVHECGPFFYEHVNEALVRVRDDLRLVVNQPSQIGHSVHRIFQELYYMFKGFLIALLYSVVIPIPEKEDVVRKYYRRQK